jgi:hypothetical protein
LALWRPLAATWKLLMPSSFLRSLRACLVLAGSQSGRRAGLSEPGRRQWGSGGRLIASPWTIRPSSWKRLARSGRWEAGYREGLLGHRDGEKYLEEYRG